jgi:hypothetical protein
MALPAKEPHAERHHELDYLLRGCIAPGYIGATDLLTRTGPESDFATDACIRRAGIDPNTGARYLEELAFEVVGEQSLKDITMRAEDLSRRGVRRVVAIFAKTGEVREWSPQMNAWRVIDPKSTFEDPTLTRPISVAALVDAAEADDAVVRALAAKKNRVIAAIEAASFERGIEQGLGRGIEQGREQGLEHGIEQGLRDGITTLCRVLSIPLDASRHAELDALDAAGLTALMRWLETERRWPSPNDAPNRE